MRELQKAIDIMKLNIVNILEPNTPSIYIYGSYVLNDFKLGWSDIDILVLTESQITEEQAKSLVGLRQAMLIKVIALLRAVCSLRALFSNAPPTE